MADYTHSLAVIYNALLPVLVASIGFNLWLYRSRPKYPPHTDIQHQDAQQTQLPSGWWTDESRFQAEKRAIFSQTWICVTHRGRFAKPGDYFSTKVAGFRIFLILGKDGQVRAWHNVCRHRAFPVTKRAEGSTMILGCGYHGWSYNTTGALTKAPLFDKIPGFKKEENSLFEIQSKTDDAGFVHINFDRRKGATGGKAVVPRGTKIGQPVIIYQTSQFLHSWVMQWNFNWKVMVANSENRDIRENSLLIETGIVANSGTLPELELNHMSQIRFGMLTSIYTRRGSPFWFLVTYSPDSVGKTTLRCEAYSVKRQGTPLDEKIRMTWDDQLRLKHEGFEAIYRKATKDESSKSHIYGQTLIAEKVDSHLNQETAKGKEIKPAALQSENTEQSEAEMRELSHTAETKYEAYQFAVCQAVECAAAGKLDW